MNGPSIFVGATYWTLNGVNIFSANLVRGLQEKGMSAKILLTEENSQLLEINDKWMTKPSDLEFIELPWNGCDSWGGHWGALIRFLEENAPCIFIPNSDWRHSCVAPLLSRDVGLIGVVHSDDPLHYDHVFRQGRYWNAITAVSSQVAKNTRKMDADFANRLHVISIGVKIPRVLPPKARIDTAPLKLVYHGTLKQHQKRILDMPEIVAKVRKRGIPVHLSLIGGGPDEEDLKEAAEYLTDQGLISFPGILPHDKILETLFENDVYVLTSEFEGMPNAILEAMGQGCVPIVTNMESAVPELIRDGHNGFIVPIGDTTAFADRISALHNDRQLLKTMAERAFESVSQGNFRIENMVQSYYDLILNVCEDMESGAFKRPSGILEPPPREVAGVSIFPVERSCFVDGIGRFLSKIPDYYDFLRHVETIDKSYSPLFHLSLPVRKKQRKAVLTRLKDVNVIINSPSWTANGVNYYSMVLARGLKSLGIQTEILLTEEKTVLVEITEQRLEKPDDISFKYLPVKREDGWGAHWGAMLQYLEEQAPCIYIPNYDWRHSCICPLLSSQVAVIGIIHGYDPLYLDQMNRLGKYWNAIVCSDERHAEKIVKQRPDLSHRVEIMPYTAYHFNHNSGIDNWDKGELQRADESLYFMIQDYLSLIDKIFIDVKSGEFTRPTGILVPPPARVAETNILPVEMQFKKKNIGHFPRKDPDYKSFMEFFTRVERMRKKTL